MRRSQSESFHSEKPWHTVKSLLFFIFRYPYRVALALSCLILAKICAVSVPLVLGKVVDALNINLMSVPLILALGYGLLRFMAVLFAELRELLFASVTQKTVKDISTDLFRHLLHLDLQFHLGRHTGELSRDLERGSRAIGSLISMGLYLTIPTAIEMILVTAIMGVKYDWVFVLITVGTLIIYFTTTILITNWRVHLRRAANTMESQGNAHVVDALLNFETVKYFNNETYELDRYRQTLTRWSDSATRNQKGLAYLNASQSLITSACTGLVLWQAMVAVQAGTISVGGLVTLTTLLLQLFIPLNMLGVLYREVRHAIADIEKMFALRNLRSEIVDPPLVQTLPRQTGTTHLRTIEFRHINFAYHRERPILQDFNLTLPAGTTTAVVGASGGGKSTLVRLLFRFYEVSLTTPNSGIFIDGINIRDLSLAELRAQIAIVPQDTVLFNTTIYENIAYGKPNATSIEIEQCARAAHLHEFIESLPAGYQTTVGERGLKLSGGEKQRVAIARALLKNPPIMIFDEATSALDSHAEQAVQNEIERASIGRTALIIAHRLSTVQNADNIAVIDQGRVVEHGSHAKLLEQQGFYYRLWMTQLREKESVA